MPEVPLRLWREVPRRKKKVRTGDEETVRAILLELGKSLITETFGGRICILGQKRGRTDRLRKQGGGGLCSSEDRDAKQTCTSKNTAEKRNLRSHVSEGLFKSELVTQGPSLVGPSATGGGGYKKQKERPGNPIPPLSATEKGQLYGRGLVLSSETRHRWKTRSRVLSQRPPRSRLQGALVIIAGGGSLSEAGKKTEDRTVGPA